MKMTKSPILEPIVSKEFKKVKWVDNPLENEKYETK